jgi:hypothetical protein
MKDNKRVSSTRSMNGYARFRDIRQAPDGKIYAMTESPNRFVLLRIINPVVTSVEEEISESEEENILYPNPAVGQSTLSFYVPAKQLVSVRIYSPSGILIKELTAQPLSIGKHTLKIETDSLPQGFYHIELNKGGSRTFLKLINL